MARLPQSDVRNERGAGGLRYYLAVRGTARVTEGGAPELLKRLGAVYLGPEVKFPPGDNPPAGWIMRIVPDSWHGYGPSSEPDAAESERRTAAPADEDRHDVRAGSGRRRVPATGSEQIKPGTMPA